MIRHAKWSGDASASAASGAVVSPPAVSRALVPQRDLYIGRGALPLPDPSSVREALQYVVGRYGGGGEDGELRGEASLLQKETRR